MINKLKKNRRLFVLIVFAICLSMGFMKPVFAQENSLTVRLQAHLSVLADAKLLVFMYRSFHSFGHTSDCLQEKRKWLMIRL